MGTRSRAINAGLLYFVGVFAAGFAFGGIRLMLVVPAVGETWAVVIETPFILGLSWLLCVRAIRKFQVDTRTQSRLLMGAVAFVCLLVAEYVLWTGMFANPPATFLPRYQTLSGLIGLFGQLLYAVFPLLQVGRRKV